MFVKTNFRIFWDAAPYKIIKGIRKKTYSIIVLTLAKKKLDMKCLNSFISYISANFDVKMAFLLVFSKKKYIYIYIKDEIFFHTWVWTPTPPVSRLS